jgi:transposase
MAEHHDGRTYSREVLENYRFRALVLRKDNWQVRDIAHAFGLHPASVSRWFVKVRKGGKKSLRRTKAKGAEPKLRESERRKILQWVECPATDFGFDTPLWTCRRIQQLVKKNCGIEIHNSNVWEWLRKWGLTNQRPEKRALQANQKEAAKWLKEEWPVIKSHAKRWRAIIYFVDEGGVSLIPVMGKTWARKGKTPIVNVTGNKGGFCVTSAVSPSGRMLFRMEKEKVRALVHIQFLKQILRHHPRRRIIVVEDKAPPHIAKEVKDFVAENRKRFALYHIPAYSPQLNPDEEVWNYLKNKKLKAHQIMTKKDFKPFVIGRMRSIQKDESLVRSFFYKLDLT